MYERKDSHVNLMDVTKDSEFIDDSMTNLGESVLQKQNTLYERDFEQIEELEVRLTPMQIYDRL